MIEKETSPVQIRKLKIQIQELEAQLTKTQTKVLDTANLLIQFHQIMITQVACTDLLMAKGIVTSDEVAEHLRKVAKDDENRDQKDS